MVGIVRMNSPTINLLKLIRDIGHSSTGLTVYELLYVLNNHTDWGYPWQREERRLRMRLEELRLLGLVRATDVEFESGHERWAISDMWQPPPADRNVDRRGDGNDGPPRLPDNGDDDAGGGGGIAEVLSHPRLFSVDGTAFDRLVDNLFVDENAG